MTADKSPPLPDSVGRIVAEMRDAAKDGNEPAFHVGETLTRWATRLAALTDGAEPVAWVNPDMFAAWQSAPGMHRLHPQSMSTKFYSMPLYTAPRPSVALVMPTTCDGKEQEAFEAWASSQKYVMDTHPLHWLFLDSKTYAARQGWRAAIEYCNAALSAVSATPGGTVDDLNNLPGMWDQSDFMGGKTDSTPAPAESLEAECQFCLGDGYLHDADMICNRCNGNGKEPS